LQKDWTVERMQPSATRWRLSPTTSANPHSAENLARLCSTITYEIITRLGNRARRVLED
jgi:hypothetical protein